MTVSDLFPVILERAMGIEPTSEAWEACNPTQKTLDWRHFCDFRNALIGKQWKMGNSPQVVTALESATPRLTAKKLI